MTAQPTPEQRAELVREAYSSGIRGDWTAAERAIDEAIAAGRASVLDGAETEWAVTVYGREPRGPGYVDDAPPKIAAGETAWKRIVGHWESAQ